MTKRVYENDMLVLEVDHIASLMNDAQRAFAHLARYNYTSSVADYKPEASLIQSFLNPAKRLVFPDDVTTSSSHAKDSLVELLEDPLKHILSFLAKWHMHGSKRASLALVMLSHTCKTFKVFLEGHDDFDFKQIKMAHFSVKNYETGTTLETKAHLHPSYPAMFDIKGGRSLLIAALKHGNVDLVDYIFNLISVGRKARGDQTMRSLILETAARVNLDVRSERVLTMLRFFRETEGLNPLNTLEDIVHNPDLYILAGKLKAVTIDPKKMKQSKHSPLIDLDFFDKCVAKALQSSLPWEKKYAMILSHHNNLWLLQCLCDRIDAREQSFSSSEKRGYGFVTRATIYDQLLDDMINTDKIGILEGWPDLERFFMKMPDNKLYCKVMDKGKAKFCHWYVSNVFEYSTTFSSLFNRCVGARNFAMMNELIWFCPEECRQSQYTTYIARHGDTKMFLLLIENGFPWNADEVIAATFLSGNKRLLYWLSRVDGGVLIPRICSHRLDSKIPGDENTRITFVETLLFLAFEYTSRNLSSAKKARV